MAVIRVTPGGNEVGPARNADWAVARFNWLRSIRYDGTLSPMARLLAHELALTTWNSDTGQCNPGPQALAARLRCAPDTIKRALAELVRAGCIRREVGAVGRGRTANIVFLARAEIVQFQDIKRGVSVPPFTGESGSEMPPFSPDKGGQNCTPNDEKGGQICVEKGGKNAPQNPRKESYTRADTREGSGQDHRLAMFAEKIRAGRYVAPSALTPSDCRQMIALSMVSPDQLRAAGFQP